MATLIENAVRITKTFDDICKAIIEKGVTPSGGVDTYADAIDNIDGGGTLAKVDTFSWPMFNSALTTSVDIGFKPKQLAILNILSSSSLSIKKIILYDERFSTTQFVYGGINNSGGGLNIQNLNQTPSGVIANYLISIDNQGFTVVGSDSSPIIGYYFAIG